MNFAERAFGARWYAVVDDLIGGYAITLRDAPLSQAEKEEGEVGLFLTGELAQHIVRLHNEWLEESQ